MATPIEAAGQREEPKVYGERWKSKECAGPSEVRLISADNRLFFVPTHLLQSHSTVLCDMLELPATESPPSITLSDPDLESAAQLALFLLVIQGNNFFAARSQLPYVRYEQVITVDHLSNFFQFARKYDCPNALLLWENFLYYLVREEFRPRGCIAKPLDVFVLAAQADLGGLASLVLDLYQPSLVTDTSHHSRSSSDYPSPFGYLQKHLPFTLGSIPVETWKHIPLRYLFALQKSTAELDGSTEPTSQQSGVRSRKLRFEESLILGKKL
ncbi:hypothetical protein L202_03187 [Cryptococcus amylolentus CBS 6039]|uniref:Uncharacterized protein n=2 Tax=Cryptococcus amylolentus TaxID=104669 RepID=A0A1E3HXN7_9TREE|nr:hypothetical protein L202_03187 [Cryptococcus amylolentus CBS 6039]ODN81092.1 hypothetical protein L202_03187 [Cryptococcus amylolentus CBS 6039]ODO09552.1 hypothetical protein I350_03155 [Cryptococcus amylolentus CBS 6273]